MKNDIDNDTDQGRMKRLSMEMIERDDWILKMKQMTIEYCNTLLASIQTRV